MGPWGFVNIFIYKDGLISQSVCLSTHFVGGKAAKAGKRSSFILKEFIDTHSASVLESDASFWHSKQRNQLNKIALTPKTHSLLTGWRRRWSISGRFCSVCPFATSLPVCMWQTHPCRWSAEDTVVLHSCIAAWGSFSSRWHPAARHCPAMGALGSLSLQGHSAPSFLSNWVGLGTIC